MLRYGIVIAGVMVTGGGFFAAAGCATEESAGPQKQSSAELTEAGLEAKDFFVTRAYPAMKPACGNCHSGTGGGGTQFLDGAADSSYTRLTQQAGLISEPTSSPLINHLHQDRSITLTPELRSILTQWLNLEASARGLTGSIKAAPTLSEAYKDFANCMNFDIWEYYRVGDLPFTQTDLDGPCMGCHSTGQAGAWLSAASRETFEQSKQFPYIQKYVVGQVDDQGRFQKLIPSNRFIDKANEPCPKGKTDCHPTFGLPPNVQNAITNFVQTTLQNLAGGTCNAGISTAVRDAGADGGNDAGK